MRMMVKGGGGGGGGGGEEEVAGLGEAVETPAHITVTISQRSLRVICQA